MSTLWFCVALCLFSSASSVDLSSVIYALCTNGCDALFPRCWQCDTDAAVLWLFVPQPPHWLHSLQSFTELQNNWKYGTGSLIVHKDAHVRTTPGGTRRALATGEIRLPPPTPGKVYDPTFPPTPRSPRTPGTARSGRLYTSQSARLSTSEPLTPPRSSQPWMSLPGLTEPRTARMFAKVPRGVNGQLPPLPTPAKNGGQNNEEGEGAGGSAEGKSEHEEQAEQKNEDDGAVVDSPRDDQPDSPMKTSHTSFTAQTLTTGTPTSAIARTPRSVSKRMDYERRCWPFNSDMDAMEREDRREARKKAAALRQAANGVVSWDQPGMTSHALSFGLGLAAQTGHVSLTAAPPATPALRPPGSSVGRQGGILMVPTPSGVEKRVIKDSVAADPAPQEGSEMLVVHHHYMEHEEKQP